MPKSPKRKITSLLYGKQNFNISKNAQSKENGFSSINFYINKWGIHEPNIHNHVRISIAIKLQLPNYAI